MWDTIMATAMEEDTKDIVTLVEAMDTSLTRVTWCYLSTLARARLSSVWATTCRLTITRTTTLLTTILTTTSLPRLPHTTSRPPRPTPRCP